MEWLYNICFLHFILNVSIKLLRLLDPITPLLGKGHNKYFVLIYLDRSRPIVWDSSCIITDNSDQLALGLTRFLLKIKGIQGSYLMQTHESSYKVETFRDINCTALEALKKSEQWVYGLITAVKNTLGIKWWNKRISQQQQNSNIKKVVVDTNQLEWQIIFIYCASQSQIILIENWGTIIYIEAPDLTSLIKLLLKPSQNKCFQT